MGFVWFVYMLLIHCQMENHFRKKTNSVASRIKFHRTIPAGCPIKYTPLFPFTVLTVILKHTMITESSVELKKTHHRTKQNKTQALSHRSVPRVSRYLTLPPRSKKPLWKSSLDFHQQLIELSSPEKDHGGKIYHKFNYEFLLQYTTVSSWLFKSHHPITLRDP